MFENKTFQFDIDPFNMPEDDVAYFLIPIKSHLTGITIQPKGIITFIPSADDKGESTLAIIAVNDTCAQTKIISFEVHTKPELAAVKPVEFSINMNQSQNITFQVHVQSKGNITLNWSLDGVWINGSGNNYSILFNPGFELSGAHYIAVQAVDSFNLSSRLEWALQIGKVNRAPVLVHNIPDYTIYKNTASKSYNLKDYFTDPEGHRMSFDYKKVFPLFVNVSYINISVNISTDSSVFLDPETNKHGPAYLEFYATDIFNLTSKSNVVKVTVLDLEPIKEIISNFSTEFCGNQFCGENENCSSCTFDCGPCQQGILEGCRPNWQCSKWNECQPLGFMYRNCTDINLCDDIRTEPIEILGCVYTGNCNDSIRNGIEEGVDCGGPCPTCPTCSDNIKNQGEEDVDCGGPCNLCPSCTDGVANINESDVDCGGVCEPCQSGMACISSKDCISLNCEQNRCVSPSCFDQVKNQGELGIDCAGPCSKVCGTCTDGEKSLGEDGIDCGGICKPCAVCNDGAKNQDEWLIDCGGSCRKCEFKDFLFTHPLISLLILITLVTFNAAFYGYFYFLLAKPERAKRLYDNNSFFMLMTELSRLTRGYRKLLKRKPILSQDQIKSFRSEINKASTGNIDSLKLHQLIEKLYVEIFNLPDNYDDHIFYAKAKESRMPIFLKPLTVGFYKKADILQVDTFIPHEKKLELIAELKFLLSELSQE